MSPPTASFGSPVTLSVFMGELVLSTLLLLLVLLTVTFAPSIRRGALSVNVYFAFLIYSISYLLLVISGHLHDQRPPLGVCLLQSMLQYASFPLCGATVLALSVQIWLRVFWPSTENMLVNRLLVVGPFAIWGTILIEVLVIGLFFQDEVVREGMPYCWIRQPIPGLTCRALLALLLLPSMVFQGLTFRSLFASRSAPLGVNKEHRRALRYRLARMCVFSAGSLGALGLALAFGLQANESVPTILIQGACPLWAVLVFGIQRDMFAIWLCWPQQRKLQTESDIHLVLEEKP